MSPGETNLWLASHARHELAAVRRDLRERALEVGVHGLVTASLPLASVLLQGNPGCTQHVSPDVLDLYVPARAA